MAKKSGSGPEYGEPIERTLKQITKLLEEAGRKTHCRMLDTFRAFVAASYGALTRAPDPEWREIIRGHEAAINLYADALGELVFYTASQPTRDVLGSLYMRLELGNPAAGQYFTPWAVASVMARMTLGDLLTGSGREPSPEDPQTVLDPACGSGVMLLAAAAAAPREMIDAGLIRFYGIDIDPLASEMARLNLRLHMLPGQIICGDALTMNIGMRDDGSDVTTECRGVPSLPPRMPLWATEEFPVEAKEVISPAAVTPQTVAPAPTVTPPASCASPTRAAHARRKEAREVSSADEQLGFAFGAERLRRMA